MCAKTYCIKTFGCQMNDHDSLKISGTLEKMGYEPVSSPDQADLMLINTCTVREKAHHKAFSEIGRAVSSRGARHLVRSQAPREIIAVCGCVAQEEGAKLLSRFPEIDIIFGPDQIDKLPQLLQISQETGRPALAVELINSPDDYHFLDALSVTNLKGAQAYVTIMKGCNSHCSYCIVPKVRGTEVYRPWREIVQEVQYLVEKGCREVTLLGQNVNSYGHNAPDGIHFGKLIRLVSDNTDIERIRFTSPHPKDVREDLVEEYKNNPKLCSHIHLPLQSGSDSVLRRMRRAYNRKTYLSKIEQLREARPGIAITTDMIVGFCGETDAEFQETLEFMRDIRFDQMYAFKYSPRPDTEAFALPDSVEQHIKEKRLSDLLTFQAKISNDVNQAYVGKMEPVLVEGGDKMGKTKAMGRNSGNKIVNFSGHEVPVGSIVDVAITRAFAHSLEGIWKKNI
ncbi:MAG: tRNA (N6-isopentenyl adenosine(37)-C2)-methylthiotransferase MiaB [Deltaproteobacteria bacterium]|nr:tRNA (N6-isopentenyl adenosine(37)-C2)-methylthiotransferase MiaB [Deltaproteobacteria bacterium]